MTITLYSKHHNNCIGTNLTYTRCRIGSFVFSLKFVNITILQEVRFLCFVRFTGLKDVYVLTIIYYNTLSVLHDKMY